jgi:hypothetical protein
MAYSLTVTKYIMSIQEMVIKISHINLVYNQCTLFSKLNWEQQEMLLME